MPASNLDVLKEIQTRLSSFPLLVKPEFLNIPTGSTACSYSGITCDVNCKITSIDTGVFWIDKDVQGAWSIWDGGSIIAQPRYSELDKLVALEIYHTPLTLGVLPGEFFPLTIQSYTVKGDGNVANTGITGTFPTNLLDVTYPSLIILVMEGLNSVTGNIEFSDIGQCIDPLTVLSFTNMPNFAVDNTLCFRDGSQLVFLINVPISGIAIDSLCISKPNTFYIIGTHFSMLLPDCFWEDCENDDELEEIVIADNRMCFIGQSVSDDIMIPEFDGLVPVGSVGRRSISTKCNVERDNTLCIDCNGREDIEMDGPFTDVCNICGGNGEECRDCFRIPFGTNVYDRCEVCGGRGDTCLDCKGDPFGTNTYDRCNVCNGNNDCVDCCDIAYGTSKYDLCGVCGGENECVDCTLTPHGDVKIDQCGECGGTNECRPCKDVDKDACGVCRGDDSSCSDCLGVPHGTAILDVCNVCEGDGSSCLDCQGVADGSSMYDVCGVCDGDGTSCNGCDGVPHGTKVYDLCGICGGNNECVDCLGIICGLATYDRCDVCDGDGSSCVDCAGIPFGTKKLNRCHQCIELVLHDDDDNCLEELLEETLHTKLALYGWLLLVAIVLFFIAALCCASRYGASIFLCCCGWCFRAPRKSKRDDSQCEDKRAVRLSDDVCWEKSGAQPKPQQMQYNAPVPNVFHLTLILVLSLVHTGMTQAVTPAEKFYVAICASTSYGDIGSILCDVPVANPCTKWGPQFIECYGPENKLIRRVTLIDIEGEISSETFGYLRHAESITILADNTAIDKLTMHTFSAIDFTVFTNLNFLWLQSVDMNNNGLPLSLNFAVKLRTLKLIECDLGGELDQLLCSLPNLSTLVIRGAALTGNPFCEPVELYQSLRILDLRNNMLSGQLPDLSPAKKMEELYLDRNMFTTFADPGQLFFGHFPSDLRILCLAFNKFVGQFVLPFSWFNAAKLEELYVDGNMMSGQLPAFSIGDPEVFHSLGASFNEFNGFIPINYADRPFKYKVFRVNNNRLVANPAGGFGIPPFPNFQDDALCGECAFECNLYCDGVDEIPDVFITSRCTYSLEEDKCGNSCANFDCLDCSGEPGSLLYDECDVCGGDGSSCIDCNGVPNGPSVYDVCDVCDGHGTTCLDCNGIANGAACYDACDVCGGDSSTCADCDGTPLGAASYDACDICGGSNMTCSDCLGVLFGNATFDEDGVCNGNGTTMLGPLEEDLQTTTNAFIWLSLALVALVVTLCCLAFALMLVCGRFNRLIKKAQDKK